MLCAKQWKRELGKFNSKSDEGVFVGNSSSSKAYKVFSERILCVEESVHLIFDESGKLNYLNEKEDS